MLHLPECTQQLVQVDLHVAGLHFLVSQTHLAVQAFVQQLPLQLVLVFVLLPAIAANDINMAVPAIKI